MKTNIPTTIFITLSLLVLALNACTPADGVLEVQVEQAEQAELAETAETAEVPESLRSIAAAFLSGSIDVRIATMQFITVPCTTADGLGGPPKCLEGQAEGTEVEVFPMGGGEGHFATPETVMAPLDFTVRGLYAVYRVPADAYRESYWPAGEYALLFDRDQNDLPLPITVLVADGKVVRIDYGVGTPPEDILMDIAIEDVLVAPADVAGWLNP